VINATELADTKPENLFKFFNSEAVTATYKADSY